MPRTYRYSSDSAELDRELVHRWLSTDAYWAIGRAREIQDAAIDGSRNFGGYDEASGDQVAYARVVTDGVTFAWLCDVYVDPAVRGEGVGVALVEQVVTEIRALGVRRIVLVTGDAHGLYERFGFTAIDTPERWMVLGAS
ncbi:GNAT family N-acetyltransferase [Agromyces aerolatus]|uniref:GNAT family N-acetyltransferase n=1 Tax=Agromyces sp. LY-1074 TaxID=3074080 RepID=UPI0028551ECF|nr:MULTISPECIES: GNAT family N-acetyltransferase [unclassified Agromyces]MDR5699661.1 GNAT family N-acetyltransferase [Agromyces sp. LY-1074]MDR5705957.1 GNAT family N-acetyltransferase [Agromyces sp. LY-1358]